MQDLISVKYSLEFELKEDGNSISSGIVGPVSTRGSCGKSVNFEYGGLPTR
jgi:hypothetical protein